MKKNYIFNYKSIAFCVNFKYDECEQNKNKIELFLS